MQLGDMLEVHLRHAAHEIIHALRGREHKRRVLVQEYNCLVVDLLADKDQGAQRGLPFGLDAVNTYVVSKGSRCADGLGADLHSLSLIFVDFAVSVNHRQAELHRWSFWEVEAVAFSHQLRADAIFEVEVVDAVAKLTRQT